MPKIIQLLTVENTLSRSHHAIQQHLVFLLRAANLGYDKQVDIIWAGMDGNWQQLPANYMSTGGDGHEYWQAEITLESPSRRHLPGIICFAVRLRHAGIEYWDNNQGDNYTSLVNVGVILARQIAMQNLSLHTRLEDGQQWLTIKIALNDWFAADRVVVHWSTDHWQHSRQSRCRKIRQRKHSHTQIWTARLKLGDAFRVQFAVSAKSGRHELWDNNGGANYKISHDALKVLILNLHCYQEPQQDEKFWQIANAIDELNVDVVCFQEVAEHWNNGYGDWASNSANIINQRLKQAMHLYSDWSHIGFDKYREGVAILSRYPLLDPQSRYVSNSHDVYNIHSRKVVMARIELPYLGAVNIFSAHLSWWEDGFQQQFQRLCEWSRNLMNQNVSTTLLCGDFNITAGSIGYREVVQHYQYEDQFLAANAQGLFEKIFRVNDPHWRDYPTDDYRIDYIFLNKDSELCVTSAKALFTDRDYGQVSDHCGYLMIFEPK